MSARQLWEGADASPWIRNLNGRTKLLFLFLYAVLMITIDNPRTLFYLFLMTLVLHGLAGTSFSKWRVLMVLILLGLWGSMLSQALFFAQMPRTPLLVLIPPDTPILGALTGGLYIYREGVLYGSVQGLRAVSMLSLGLLICWTSDPRQLLNGLLAWHLSPQVAFLLVTAIRFLPVLASETEEILIALRLRDKELTGRLAVVRHLPYVAKPLLARCLWRAQTLALSVVSRGFFSSKVATQRIQWRTSERSVCAALLVLTLAIVFSKISFVLAEQGLYIGTLRWFYDFSNLYL
ncbi:MAG: energy-coupling factor transporter transmembrane component T family protein [Succiniclasticum sp.]|jgi:energy-coupling factor transport system permease protein